MKTQFTQQCREGVSGIIQIPKSPMFIFQTAFISFVNIQGKGGAEKERWLCQDS